MNKHLNENEFKIGDVTYVAVDVLKTSSCEGCAFDYSANCGFAPDCWPEARDDRKDVIFVAKDDKGQLASSIDAEAEDSGNSQVSEENKFNIADLVVPVDLSGQELTIKPDYSISFHNDNGTTKVGKLYFNGSTLKFEGDADASAKSFIDFVESTFVGRFEADKKLVARLAKSLEWALGELGREPFEWSCDEQCDAHNEALAALTDARDGAPTDAAPTVVFDVEADKFGNIMTKEKWQSCVAVRAFLPSDGCGYWGTAEHYSYDANCFKDAPPGATHVHWYNK